MQAALHAARGLLTRNEHVHIVCLREGTVGASHCRAGAAATTLQFALLVAPTPSSACMP